MLPKAIIFDLDDTIISLKGTANKTWKIISQEYSEQYKNVDSTVLYDTITETRLAYWNDKKSSKRGRLDLVKARREILEKAFTKLHLPIKDSLLIADDFSSRRLAALELFPKAIETLDYLINRGIKLSLMSNGASKSQRCKIEKFSLDKYFCDIQIEEEVGYGKPDTRIYLDALNNLNLSAKDVWCVGDNLEWEVKAPQSLGIYAIWNDFEKKGLPTNSKVKPNRIINNISDILNQSTIKHCKS